MEIIYSDNGKRAYFNGMWFTRDDHTGYYLNSTTRTRLHRAVYEAVHGKIPDGAHIHHKDGNKGNNMPENLALLDGIEHIRLHGEMLTDEQREQRRRQLSDKARPVAAKWHGSKTGIKWHSEHAKKVNAFGKRTEKVCVHCGRAFCGTVNSQYCSNACKSAARRASCVDNVPRICAYCGGTFYVNRYAKQECCSKSCGRGKVWKDSKDRKVTA